VFAAFCWRGSFATIKAAQRHSPAVTGVVNAADHLAREVCLLGPRPGQTKTACAPYVEPTLVRLQASDVLLVATDLTPSVSAMTPGFSRHVNTALLVRCAKLFCTCRDGALPSGTSGLVHEKASRNRTPRGPRAWGRSAHPRATHGVSSELNRC